MIYCKQWLKRNWIHLIIITVSILYFFSSPYILVKYGKKYGKPVSYDGIIPEPGYSLVVGPLELNIDVKENEKLYSLDGWAFSSENIGDEIRYLILSGKRESFVYPVETIVRGDFHGMPVAGSPNVGVKAFIAPNSIPVDQYRVNLLSVGTTKSMLAKLPYELHMGANRVSMIESNSSDHSKVAESVTVDTGNLVDAELTYSIDTMESTDKGCIYFDGYVYDPGVNASQLQSVFITFFETTGTSMVAYKTNHISRPDVPIWFKDYQAGNPGFSICVPSGVIQNGAKKIGFILDYGGKLHYAETQYDLH